MSRLASNTSGRTSGAAFRAWLAALAAVSAACGTWQAPTRVVAQETVLKLQIEGLRQLVAAAEAGSLLPRDKLVVAVSEQLVKDLAQLALPRDQVIAGKYRVRIEKVDVRFRDKHGSVRLDGRVSPAASSAEDVFADLALFGLVDKVELDQTSGVLRGNVSVIGFELQRVGVYGDSAAGRRLLEELAVQQVGSLATLALPLTIPVKLEQEVTLKGITDGPVRLSPVTFPLKVSVADVSAYGQRLWVAFDVVSGPWRKGVEEVQAPVPASSPSAGQK